MLPHSESESAISLPAPAAHAVSNGSVVAPRRYAPRWQRSVAKREVLPVSSEGDELFVGRRGHARVVILTIIDEEFEAVQRALGAVHEVSPTGAFSCVSPADANSSFPFVLIQARNRSLGPAQGSARTAMEDWRPARSEPSRRCQPAARWSEVRRHPRVERADATSVPRGIQSRGRSASRVVGPAGDNRHAARRGARAALVRP